MAARNIVADGDSYQIGVPAATGWQPFPGLTWVSWQKDGRFVNRGVGGRDSSGVVAAFAADIDPFSPQHVFLQMGAADHLADVAELDLLKANVQTAVAYLRPRCTFTLLNIPHHYHGGDAAERDRYVAYNTWLGPYCAANGVDLIDVYADFDDPGNPGNPKAGYISSDGYHPSPLGYQRQGTLMAARCPTGTMRDSLTFATRTQNLIADPNMLTDSNSNGAADWIQGTAKNGTPTITPSLVTNPAGGKFQRITYAGNAATDTAYYRSGLIEFAGGVNGGTYDSACDFAMSNTTGTVCCEVMVELFNASNGACGTFFVVPSCSVDTGATLRARGSGVATALPAKYRYTINFRNAGSCVADVGRAHLFLRPTDTNKAKKLVTGVL